MDGSTHAVEDALVRRSKAGDREAFGSLVKRHAGRANGVAFLLLGSHADAVDASQEAFVRAWQGLTRFSGEVAFFGWYSGILRNVCREYLRRDTRAAERDRLDAVRNPVSQDDPSLLAERNERTERLWAALLRLPAKHREVIVMSHFQSLRYREIAEALDIPIGTVMSRLHQARKALRDQLSEEKP